MRFLVVVVLGLLAGLPAARAQNVSAICDTYARDAVALHIQNLEGACGFSGPEWNGDYRYHFDWCINGRNYESAQRWTDWRKARIAQCRTAAAPQPRPEVAAACQSYATRAVAQEQTNQQLGCGFAGPEWNGDYRYHYDWCVQGNNASAAPGGDRRREEQLAQCRLAQAPRPAVPAPGPATPPQGSEWAGRIDGITSNVLSRLDRDMRNVNALTQQAQGRLMQLRPVDVAGLIAATQPPRIAQTYQAFEQSHRGIFESARVAPKDLHLPPKINAVLTTPQQGRVEPGSAVLVTGANFGNRPGRLYLVYTTRRETPGTEFRPEETVRETVELRPYRASWAESWFSNVVMATAPVTFTDPNLVADRQGELQLVLPDGSIATAPIVVAGGFPEIHSVETASGGGWIRPGEVFTVRGRNFGPSGRARLWAADPARRIWQRIRGTDRYVYWTPHGMTASAGSSQVGLSVVRWSDDTIQLRAGGHDPQRYFSGGGATLEIENAAGRAGMYNKLGFGPDNKTKRVSGLAWLERSARGAAKATPDGSAMVVTHVPSCGWTDSGEDGADRFFADVPWPQDVEVIAFDFKEIDPEDPYSDLDFFADQMGALVNAVASGIFGVAKYVAALVLDAVFGGGGGYHAYVMSGPGGYSWENNPHIIVIDWETDCALGGKPIMYVVSFTIAGTEAALARY